MVEPRAKWRVEFNEARESDLPNKLEPIGYCRGITAEKVSSIFELQSNNSTNILDLVQLSHHSQARDKYTRVKKEGRVCYFIVVELIICMSIACDGDWYRSF